MTAEQGQLSVEHSSVYQAEISSILGRQLVADSIDTYADDALTDLVEVVEQVTDSYAAQPTSGFKTRRETETAAFSYYGLGDIEKILDHIADKAEEIKSIDATIARTTVLNSVITPPDPTIPARLEEGDGSYEQKRTIPRLKTILFILSNDFDIDINDDEQLHLKSGILSPRMVRKQSYVSVEIPSLSRNVLVCDEEGSATFVFNTALLEQFGITSEDLLGLTKTDMKDLLEENHQLGKRVVYSKEFVLDIVATLGDESEAQSGLDVTGSYLRPTAPEGILSIYGISKQLGAINKTVARAIEALGDSIGPTELYKFGSNTTEGYEPGQVELIRQELERRGQYLGAAPEGLFAKSAMVEEFKVNHHTIVKAIEELGDALGPAERYKTSGNIADYYNSEQKDLIRDWLDVEGFFSDEAPDDFRSAESLKDDLECARETVLVAVESLGAKLGQTNRYRFSSKVAIGFSPVQQELIAEELVRLRLKAEKPPEGYLPISRVAGRFGVSSKTVAKAIDALGAEFGSVKGYQFTSKVYDGYSPLQQELIRQQLEIKGRLDRNKK